MEVLLAPVAPGPRLAQGHGGILPQGQLPPCAVLGVAQAPEPLAGWHDFQEQAAGIVKRITLVGRLGLIKLLSD